MLSHPVPDPVSTSKPHSGALGHSVIRAAVVLPRSGLRIYHARYDAQNRRIFSWNSALDTLYNRNATVYYYTPGGQKLGAYQFNIVQSGPPPTLYVTLMTSDRYFGSERLAPQDRLGLAGDFYPCGCQRQQRPPGVTPPTGATQPAASTTPTTATAPTNTPASTPDPYKSNVGSAGDPSDPGSWNKYAYTIGDPVNRYDLWGTNDTRASTFCVTGTGYLPGNAGGGIGGGEDDAGSA